MISSSNKSCPIPIDCPEGVTYEVGCKSAAIGNNIWILHGNNMNSDDYNPLKVVTPEMFIFDCETQRFTKVDIDFPPDFGDLTRFMTSYNDHLYIWRYHWSDRWEVENGFIGYRLFNLDTKTMKWDEMVDISTTKVESFTPVIDMAMYILDGEDDVMKIDLITKNVDIVESSGHGYFPEWIIDDDKLYMKQYSDDFEATITSEFGNGVVRQLDCNNENTMSYCVGNNFFESENSGESVCLDSIDFKTNRVVRRVVDSKEQGENHKWIDTVSQIDDTIYTIISVVDDTNRLSYKMCVLSLTPKLWSICMLQLVDQFGNNEEEMERIKEKLPMQLRKDIDSFINWRVGRSDVEENTEPI